MNAFTRLAVLLLLPGSLSAQGFLEQFSYEGLRLAAIGVDGGFVVSNSLTTEAVGGVRLDFGTFAPRIRIVTGVSYFKGAYKDERIQVFEQRLEDLIQDPSVDVTIGAVTLANVEVYLDFQYLFPAVGPVQPYFGLGFAAHVRDGDGQAIEGTFVEDALDTVAAGLGGSVGFEVGLASWLAFLAEVRGGLTSELRTLSARGGFMVRFP